MTLTVKIPQGNNMRNKVKVLGEGSLHNLIKRLSFIIKDKQDSRQPVHKDKEWTKKTLIVPLLQGLGWDKDSDIICESDFPDKNVGLDLILNCKNPVGIEIRSINEPPPRNTEDSQVKVGLRQCLLKKAPYFIWTNGDSWQFFSLALPKAALYHVSLSKTADDLSLLEQLLIIKKDIFMSCPDRFNKAIIKHTEFTALSQAWKSALHNHSNELLQVFRKCLQFVNIKDEAILKFLKTFKPESSHSKTRSLISFKPDGLWTQRRSLNSFKPEALLPHSKSSVSFKGYDSLSQAGSTIRAPETKNWERLIESYESHFRLARWFFQTSYYRKLGEYLISDDYKPWSKDSTWRYLGLLNNANEEKKVRHAVALFLEWGFIEESEGNRYFRVEGCSPYLKKLLERSSAQ